MYLTNGRKKFISGIVKTTYELLTIILFGTGSLLEMCLTNGGKKSKTDLSSATKVRSKL
jgi:hypothetical protein